MKLENEKKLISEINKLLGVRLCQKDPESTTIPWDYRSRLQAAGWTETSWETVNQGFGAISTYARAGQSLSIYEAVTACGTKFNVRVRTV